jgi:hypothetical protein
MVLCNTGRKTLINLSNNFYFVSFKITPSIYSKRNLEKRPAGLHYTNTCTLDLLQCEEKKYWLGVNGGSFKGISIPWAN